MKTIVIVAKDRVGLLADISYILGKEKINIEYISVDVVGEDAVITLGVKDIDRAKEVLRKNGFNTTEKNQIVLKLEDKPGELSNITRMLAEHKISINNVTILSRDGQHTVLAINVDKERKARSLLKDYLIDSDAY